MLRTFSFFFFFFFRKYNGLFNFYTERCYRWVRRVCIYHSKKVVLFPENCNISLQPYQKCKNTEHLKSRVFLTYCKEACIAGQNSKATPRQHQQALQWFIFSAEDTEEQSTFLKFCRQRAACSSHQHCVDAVCSFN